MRPDDLLDCPLPAAIVAFDGPPEPFLAAGPILVEFDDPDRLDPARAAAEPEGPPAASVRRIRPFGVLGSLGVHLLPLLFLLDWPSAPLEPPAAIPVQLVIEQPPPPIPAPPPEPQLPTPGRLASDNMGTPDKEAGEPDKPAAAPAAPQVAMAVPPKPAPPPPPIPDPVPPPAPRPAAQPLPLPPPLPVPRPRPQAAPAVHRVAPIPDAASRVVRVPGPDATRNEYLAYLRQVTRQHLYMLPASFVGDRHGETILLIRVLDDGTIARIAVAQGSGYPDIDARIEQIIAAIRRFPPLPQLFQEPSVDLDLRLRFPEALFER